MVKLNEAWAIRFLQFAMKSLKGLSSKFCISGSKISEKLENTFFVKIFFVVR